MAQRGINKVTIIGNAGQDFDQSILPSGQTVGNVGIATSETWNDKNTGQRQERTEWHRVVAYGKVAEIMGKYCRKGSKVYVEGRLQTRKWQDRNNMDRYTTEIVVREFQNLDAAPQNGGQQPQQAPQQQAPQQPAQQQQAPQQPAQPQQQQAPQQPAPQPDNYGAPDPSDYGAIEDEIPF